MIGRIQQECQKLREELATAMKQAEYNKLHFDDIARLFDCFDPANLRAADLAALVTGARATA